MIEVRTLEDGAVFAMLSHEIRPFIKEGLVDNFETEISYHSLIVSSVNKFYHFFGLRSTDATNATAATTPAPPVSSNVLLSHELFDIFMDNFTFLLPA